jgi:hypothetical protein
LRYQPAYNGNAVINGAFDVWQRGTSGTANGFTAATGYNADRFQNYYAGSMTTSRQATGDTTNLPFIQYCARVQRNSGQTNTGSYYIAYTMESTDSIRFAGRTVTLSWYARAGSNYSPTSSLLNYLLQTGTGTDGNQLFGFTGSATPINTSATLTTTWQRFTATATLASNIAQVGFQFYGTPTGTASTNDYFEITGVQLELGSVATTFKRSNGSGGTFQGELAACQRYYWRHTAGSLYASFASGLCTSTSAGYVNVINPVAMRIAPTAIEFSTLAVTKADASVIAITALALSYASTLTNNCNFTGASALTAGNGTVLNANNSTSAYIAFNAEL